MKSFTKGFAQQKTKFLQKYGSTEKTVEAEFEELREAYEKLRENVAQIHKDIGRQNEAIRALASPFLAISEGLETFYEEPSQNGVRYRTAAMGVDQAVREYLEKQKELNMHMEEYVGKVNALKKRIQKRDEDLLRHDRHKTNVIELTAKPGKDPTKLAEAERKFEEHKATYKETNADVTRELQMLLEDKYRDFKSEYNLLLEGLIGLFQTCSDTFKRLIDDNIEMSPRPVRSSKSPSQRDLGSANTETEPTKQLPQPRPASQQMAQPGPALPKKESPASDLPPQRELPQPKRDVPPAMPQKPAQAAPQENRASMSFQEEPDFINEQPPRRAVPAVPQHPASPPQESNQPPIEASFDSDPFAPGSFQVAPASQAPGLPSLPGLPRRATIATPPSFANSSNSSFNSAPAPAFNQGPAPALPRKDNSAQRPTPAPPQRQSKGLDGQLNDMASDAVANAATNQDNQRRVGAAVGNQMTNADNQKAMGNRIAERSDNPLVKGLATNSTVQNLVGRGASSAANNSAVQQRVGQAVADGAKDEENKKKLGGGIKSAIFK
eukprot:TRINITY_DN3910_c0_g1_i1.p1 TRINITY_DN3910_c0_g1~~TRINITY_DN3910_c0_g1_i1.p1  ORF type:complete len:552 (-),score=140.45 TRINITY_DN3910_c0_g1_i1:33-1688(-)